MSLAISDLRAEDRAQWAPLWAGYLAFYQAALADAVTETTFRRLLDPAEPMFCLV